MFLVDVSSLTPMDGMVAFALMALSLLFLSSMMACAFRSSLSMTTY